MLGNRRLGASKQSHLSQYSLFGDYPISRQAMKVHVPEHGDEVADDMTHPAGNTTANSLPSALYLYILAGTSGA